MNIYKWLVALISESSHLPGGPAAPIVRIEARPMRLAAMDLHFGTDILDVMVGVVA